MERCSHAPDFIVSMSPPSYPSARLRPRRAGFRFTRPVRFIAASVQRPAVLLLLPERPAVRPGVRLPGIRLPRRASTRPAINGVTRYMARSEIDGLLAEP